MITKIESRRHCRVGVVCWVLASACGFSDSLPSGTSSSYTLESPPPNLVLEYDAVGNVTKLGHERGATQVEYDALNRQIRSVDALAGVTLRSSTLADRATGVIDPRGVSTGYELDGFGEVIRLASPDTGETTRRYDEAGNLTASVDARGAVTSYTYDALDRLVRVGHRMGDEAEAVFSWVFDDEAGDGRLASTTFPEGSTLRTYDAEGQLASMTQQVAGVTTVTRYAYDGAGQTTAMTYPSGRRLDITWKDGAPEALSIHTAEARTPLITGIELDDGGAPRRFRWALEAGPREHVIERDPWGRVVSYPIGAHAREIGYDAGGRITSYKHVGDAEGAASELDEQFEYDALDRLVGYTRRGARVEIAYDAAGNRVSMGAQSFFMDDKSNRLLAAEGPAGTRAFTYDAAGNLIDDELRTARFDATGRMGSMTRDGRSTRYAYDGAGRRVRKQSATLDLCFVYDRAGHLLGEYDAAGAPVREYVWLGDALVAFYAGPELLFVQSDHLGAPRVAFDPKGRERWRWLASPFGEDAPETDPSGLGAIELPLRFPGQYADPESGLFYNRHRDYDPITGRYIESDPIGLEAGINTYVYVSNDPLRKTDPLGLDEWWRTPSWRTLDDAGWAAVCSCNATSIRMNREHGNWIVKNPDGSYSYDPPVLGTVDRVFLPSPPSISVGLYHTHGGYMPEYASEEFSPRDRWVSEAYRMPSYLGTPSGAVKKYAPKRGVSRLPRCP